MNTKIGSVLVIGAGISGIRSALDLAEMNHRVYLIDKSPGLGGILSQLDYQFPTDHCGMCRMLPMTDRDASSQFCLRRGLYHENIELMLGTEMVGIEGEPGNFRVTLTTIPSSVDPAKCIGCGKCAEICPIEVPDEFNAGLTRRKAVHLPVPHSIPNCFVIDARACNRCGECEKACPTGAIDLGLEARRAFRVLVVDDELVVRDSLKEWLLTEGFSVDMAGSGKEAVELLARNEYGLMLLDIKMPGMDGVEVLKVAKQMRESLPVIMMTAYATVENAVEALKIGALDYLMKPFDINAMIAKVVQQYDGTVKSPERTVQVGAVIMAAGSGFADPCEGSNTYEYKVLPNVVTSIEFERLISGTGPNGGRLLRPDGQPVGKIAWLQCVGSRNLQEKADYCSSVCCMFSIKEALLAKDRSGGAVDTAIFYMDMRTFGRDFQRYRDAAEGEAGVRFVRSRVHSVEPHEGGRLRLHYADAESRERDEVFDLVVLAVGQRPPADSEVLASIAGIERNNWGFCRTDGFAPGRTSRNGVFSGGSFSGFKDISESVIQAGAASCEASKLIHSKGGSLMAAERPEAALRDVSREIPRVALALCACGNSLAGEVAALRAALPEWAPGLRVLEIERICTKSGWDTMSEALEKSGANAVVIGACVPCMHGGKLAELSRRIGLPRSLMDVVDIRSAALGAAPDSGDYAVKRMEAALKISLQGLLSAEPVVRSDQPVVQRALVVGGGIAGMTAALSIADQGFEVDLVEKTENLGGLALRIHHTIEGLSAKGLLEETIARVESHPRITLRKSASVVHSERLGGNFLTTLDQSGNDPAVVEHGAVILASGGGEARTEAYLYGKSDSILTQLELEDRLADGRLDPAGLKAVAMIQCVGSREEGRNYCSRVCCATALKNALRLKAANPDLDVCIFYRDIMTYGFLETYYTQARRAGIMFIRYSPDRKPECSLGEAGKVRLCAMDPILGREIVFESDLLVLSTGIAPGNGKGLAEIFGIEVNEDGFFQEAEYKWLPVNSRKRGVFLAGVAHSPRSVAESVAMAQAAAQRALALISRERVPAANVTAEVRHSLCSLCESCIAACPYDARKRNDEEDIIEVDELACQGCGACAAVCPNSASVVRGYGDRRVMAMLDAALE
ncbi:MAG: FAD-dependent oxidoreductase [Desulfobacteraceae bacterium]|nr:FAD-dependent oxidoreductase [Desulfobacteraceae bacterium]